MFNLHYKFKVPKFYQLLKNNSIFICFYLANIFLQSYGINKIVYPQTDEGIYLYEAKLLAQGYIPYKDFNLAGHTPFLQYLLSIFLRLYHFNIPLFDYMYIMWVFISLFPLYSITIYLTKNRNAGIFSIFIFSTFVEFTQWDAHFFAIRETSLPFLAFFIYFTCVKKRKLLAQVFLWLFSFCLVSNLLIALLSILTINLIKSRLQIRMFCKTIWNNYTIYFVLSFTSYFIILLIPNSFHNFIISQTYFVSYLNRFYILLQILPMNWPIFLFGFWGIFLLRKTHWQFAVFSFITFLICIFAGKSFYPHYLSIIGVPFAISSGFFFNHFWNKFTIKNTTVMLLLLYLVTLTAAPSLYFYLIANKTPQFFTIVRKLKRLPEPLFTFEPIYALYAQKNIPFFYDCANMRIIRVTGTNLPVQEYQSIIYKSQTILLEPFAEAWLPQKIKDEISKNYRLVYQEPPYKIYSKK